MALTFNFISCGSSEELTDLTVSKSLPLWAKHSNIYEVNIRQYTPEGTFDAFSEHLPRLKNMGVDILWLMPINPIGDKNRKGHLGSYYSIKDYKGINPEFGTLNDLRSLVKKAHELGMHVIIDWVANHSSWDNVWVDKHPDWYTKDSSGQIIVPAGTDWTDVADLNYDSAGLREAMIDAMAYWVKIADIDGFRCDVAAMVPIDFWIEARKTIDQIKPGCFFLAEAGEPFVHKAFDMDYGWEIKDIINKIAKKENNAEDILNELAGERTRFMPEDLRMRFITNHDENSWTGSEYERLGDEAVDAFTVLIYTIPGMPLTYSGQEEPLKRPLSFFDKDLIGFGSYSKQELLTELNKLKNENKALWNITYGGDLKAVSNTAPKSILSFMRVRDDNRVLCVFNLSEQEREFVIKDVLEGSFKTYLGANLLLEKDDMNKLKPWEYAILISNK